VIFKSAVTVCLVLPAVLLANVSGFVRNDAGKPVARAFIRFVNAADSTSEESVFADTLGRYSLVLPGLVSVVSSGSGMAGSPFDLEQNSPNPVAAVTTIPFFLPGPGAAELSIVAMDGRCVDRISQQMMHGRHAIKWRPLPSIKSGTYVYRLRWNGLVAEKTMIVVNTARTSSWGGSGLIHAVPGPGVSLVKTRSALASAFRIFVYGKGVYPYTSGAVTLADGATRDFSLKYSDLWDSCRVILRDSLTNCRYQFQKNKLGKVVFLGGSVTNNPGWRDSVMVYLRARFPQTAFTFVNAGIPSVGSNMHAFRIQLDIFSSGKIDLLFVDASANDTINNVRDNINRTARSRAMEGIYRQARSHNPAIDIVSIYLALDVFYPAVKAYDSIPYLDSYERPAWHYGVTCVNLAQYVAERYTWAQFGGDVHPGLVGTQIYAKEFRRLFDGAWKDSLPASTQILRHFHPVRLLDSLCYQYGHYDSLKTAQILSGWTYVASWKPAGTAGTRDGFVNVPTLEAVAAGATLTFGFTGTAVGIVSPEGPDVGIINYQIDGIARGPLDQYTPWSSGLHIPWIWMFATDLANTHHTLVCTIANTKNSASTGYASRIMQFAVNGQ
jgi:hypothetical protein